MQLLSECIVCGVRCFNKLLALQLNCFCVGFTFDIEICVLNGSVVELKCYSCRFPYSIEMYLELLNHTVNLSRSWHLVNSFFILGTFPAYDASNKNKSYLCVLLTV